MGSIMSEAVEYTFEDVEQALRALGRPGHYDAIKDQDSFSLVLFLDHVCLKTFRENPPSDRNVEVLRAASTHLTETGYLLRQDVPGPRV